MSDLANRKSDINQVGQKLDKVSVSGLQGRLSDVEQQASTLLHNRSLGLFRHFDPRERERVANEVILIRDELEARRTLLRLYHEAQTNATKEYFDHFLVKLRLASRGELAAYAANQLESVQREMNQVRANLEQQMVEEWERINKIPVPMLQQRRKEDFSTDMERTFDLIQGLLDDFKAATERL